MSLRFPNLGAFLTFLEERRQLVRIREAVDPYLEIAEITDRTTKGGGPALLFENVRGSSIPVAINVYGTQQRMAWALGAEHIDEVVHRLENLIKLAPPRSFQDKLRMLPRLKEIADFMPRAVKKAPCQETVLEPTSLGHLPILTCWPQDGGPFITLGAVITRHPESGVRNVGIYRMQKFDDVTTGMHWQIHKVGAQHYRVARERNEIMHVAVAIGGPPVLPYAATAPLPEDLDEIAFAGVIQGQGIDMVPCRTVDLEVPAEAEIVLEGTVSPGDEQAEGPFGDHTGYYTPLTDFPVFRLTAVTQRKSPIYQTTIVGRPPQEDAWLGWATERLFMPAIRMALPEVVDMKLPVEACFHNLAIVSIKKRFPGHAAKVMHALWGLGQMSFCKCIIVVDHDVNVQDLGEVVWRVSNNIDARRDIVFTDGPVDQLDHAASRPLVGSKMGIDATAKWREEGYARDWPPVIEMTPEVKLRVDAMWARLGIPGGRT
ncbi:MAG TPA: menaquinone biosynthesis decarboxylase [Candidatus Krumholzibacteria bacterium]|nr:menaquinone biosynthesis decarboxylase [Candidatus Krumholzibacteria bacterium]